MALRRMTSDRRTAAARLPAVARAKRRGKPSSHSAGHRLRLVTGAVPVYAFSALFLALMPAVARESRVLLLIPAVVLFGVGWESSDHRGLSLLIFLTGLPLYLTLGGSDLGVAGTFLIIVAYMVSLAQGRLSWTPALAAPLALLLVIYTFDTAGLFGTGLFFSSARLLLGIFAGVFLAQLTYTHVSDGAPLTGLMYAFGLLLLFQALIVVLQRTGLDASIPFLDAISPRTQILAPAMIEGVTRASGAIGDYELTAEWFALGIPMFLGFAAVPRQRVFSLVIIGACAVGLVGTVTRGGLVAVAAGLFVLLLLCIRGGTEETLSFAASSFATLGVAVAVALTTMPSAISDLQTRLQATSGSGGFSSFSDLALLLNRSVWLERAAQLAPTAFGHGIYRMDLLGLAGPNSLHSLWLSLWYEVGAVGTVIACALLVITIVLSIPPYGAARRNPVGYLLQAALFAGFAAMMVSEFKIEFLRYEFTIEFALAYAGLMLGHNVLLARSPSDGSNIQ